MSILLESKIKSAPNIKSESLNLKKHQIFNKRNKFFGEVFDFYLPAKTVSFEIITNHLFKV